MCHTQMVSYFCIMNNENNTPSGNLNHTSCEFAYTVRRQIMQLRWRKYDYLLQIKYMFEHSYIIIFIEDTVKLIKYLSKIFQK